MVNPQRAGLVARVGCDFDMPALDRLGIDVRGVRIIDGVSPRFEIRQYEDNGRSVKSRLEVADYPLSWDLPPDYDRAHHFHLATMPVPQQRKWLEKLRSLGSGPQISVDMFESNAARDPADSRWLCNAADMAFMNEEEWRILFADHPAPDCPVVIKRGARGATWFYGDQRFDTTAPEVETVDTTGAGEIFAGAMLSLMLAGVSVEESLRRAAQVASAKVSEFGVDGKNLSAALKDVAAARRHGELIPARAAR